MSVPLPFGSNSIPVFAYENFSFTILNSVGSTVSNSAGLNPQSSYFTTDGSGNVQFTVLGSNTLVPSSFPESFTLTSNGLTSVNTVTINGGRFLDASGVTLSNNSYTFYRNETIPPIELRAPFNIKTPTSIPALPPGLSFVSNSPSNYQIGGTPLVVVPNSNYQIIGVQQGGSKVVTTRFNMIISNDRLQMNLTGTPIISGMEVGTAIDPRTITAVPPVGSSVVRYTFPLLPSGIVIQDAFGNSYSNITSFTPVDPSYTMIIRGTPDLSAAYSFKNAGAGSSGLPYVIQGSRTVPLPIVENSKALTFAFKDTILFDLSSLPTFYTGIPIDSSANFFRAATYFGGTDVSITDIFSPDLTSDLSLVFVSNLARADVSGTPQTPISGTFTVRAIDASANVRDYVTPLTVLNDAVSFSSPVGDVCYNFVLSRPLDQKLDGYYPSNIQFTATAASRRPITLTAPALAGTGLTLDPSTGSLTGVPTAITSLRNLDVVASTGTTSAIKTVKFAVLDDSILLGDVSFSFIQNVPITPFQIPVQSTLSGRNVIDYSAIGLPNGLSINPAGVVSGRCLDSDPSGTIIVSATTGFATGSNQYTFYNEPDSILFTVPQNSYSYLAGEVIDPFQVTGISFSGTTVSNFVSTLPSSYGLSLSSGGQVSGQWTDSLPPNQVLPSRYDFSFTAQAAGVSGELPVTLTANPIIEKASFVWGSGKLYKYNDASWSYVSNVVIQPPTSRAAFDIQLRNTNVDGNFILFTAYNTIWKATHTGSYVSNSLGNPTTNQYVSSLVARPISTTWWVSGTRPVEGRQTSVILRSDDNGVSWSSNYKVIEDFSTGRMLLSRDAGLSTSNSPNGNSNNPYLNAGIALKYSIDASALIAGGVYNNGTNTGPVMLRSSNASTWDVVIGEFQRECAYLSLDVSSMWVATGSDKYKTSTFDAGSFSSGGDTNTIRFSTDAGSNWSIASGGFNMFGYELVYANNIWMATGVNATTSNYTIGVKYSPDGSNWYPVDIFDGGTNPYGNISNIGDEYLKVRAPLPIGSIQYDGSNWNILVQQEIAGDWFTKQYSASHPTSTWTLTNDFTDSFPEISNDSNRRFVTWSRPNFLRTSQSKRIDIDLTFSTGIGSGPTITAPSATSFLLYQYVPMSLTFSATGSGIIYFFIGADELPPGLRFNPVTNTISGKPASQGNFTTRVFAKDNNGVTVTTVSFTVNIPRIIRKQDGAGAYTSLLRQYTEVLGAQNARDNRVLPSQERRLGEFMSPEAPDVVTQSFTTTKCKFCGRIECPTVLEVVNAGDAEDGVCDFIDANSGDVIDLGNAEPDECD